MKPTFLVMILVAATLVAVAIAPAQRKAAPPITVRTESYPRPPYSGATYYIYEQSGRTICTKLEVCNKFDECSSQYFKGAYRATEDQETGNPYEQTQPVLIPGLSSTSTPVSGDSNSCRLTSFLMVPWIETSKIKELEIQVTSESALSAGELP